MRSHLAYAQSAICLANNNPSDSNADYYFYIMHIKKYNLYYNIKELIYGCGV
ncbi:hypothetical protein Cri9333_4605 [Crinalium epipsammum PCC 9333]|uniref:Uncharacterized protein n=1 Tax=Crinalium epipsammum PCC 9333 TaxID=1173022 RepID=K9W7D7_9CYAN|nr:hypothetical protein Cri9333_4605 [Crinalium epipsammum PCC 9333]